MKKIILASILLLGSNAFGQTKGSWYLGGSAGFSMGTTTQGNTTIKRSSWSASPEIGTFLTDHIQLGLGITSSGSHSDFMTSGSLKNLQLFGDGAFRPFLGVSASYLGGQSRTSPGNNTNDISTINASFSAGFAYYVTPRIGIFGSIGVLGYTNTRTSVTGVPDIITNDFGFNASTLGNRFTIGMYYTICKGKAKE
jgi:hypothetical protein